MNERIRQLADEAAKWAQTMNWSSDPKYGDRPFSDLFNEKFAELIVKECAKEAFNFWCYQDDCNDESAQSHIKKHFGIDGEEDIDETCPRCGEPDSGTSCGIPDCGWVTGVEE